MKNLSLIINIVLAVAIGILFFLYFSLKSQVKTIASSASSVASVKDVRIAFVNMDTLYAHYDEYLDLKAQIADKQRKMENELNSKKSQYERKVMDYQDKVQKGLLLTSERQRIEQQLYADQQNLLRLGESMQNELAEETRVLNNRLGNNIVEYLKEYNKDGKYVYIMSHVFGGNLLYVNDSLDITADVIKGLNEKYRQNKKQR
ncbi:MAG TPA: OmpH family outer membrane protein [Bacteroidales bacterium]|nr:OmpH family outer membrane protein [Bacteroidales bacterium]HOK97984.1 OmpH family outer membrane protein [Bacteroidales bacterium]HPO65295.1 OmpH family outer membrane protein [Bacteroidales bacterium]